MEVVVDGIIYNLQSTGGISRVFNEILPRMCSMEDSLNFTLFTNGSPIQSLPEHERITTCTIPRVERYLRPRSLWKPIIPSVNHFLRGLCIGKSDNKIWHSTYYTKQKNFNGLEVVTVHDMIHERYPSYFQGSKNEQFRQRKKKCIEESDAIICVSQATCDDVKQFYNIPSDKLHVIHLACSDVFKKLQNDKKDSKTPINKPFFLYVGTRRLYKNFKLFIESYSLWQKGKDVDLVLVGPVLSEEEKVLFSKLGVDKQVHCVGNVDDDDLCSFYNRAIALVYPSLYEGFGIPLLEAMACGCPVIASKIPTSLEIAGNCPFYFDPKEKEDLMNAFNQVLSTDAVASKVAQGLRQAKSFSWTKTAKETLNVYKKFSNMQTTEKILTN